MATKCMSCGGSMKKMMTGGTRKRYQDGGPTLEDLEKQTRREFLKGKSAKIGLGTVGAGITSIIGKKISDVVKKKREGNKEVKGLVKNLVKKAKSTRVMQKGGATLPMMGMPMYSNNPRSEQGRILKNGGSTTNRAVAPGCRGGMVKDASGKCVMERKMQKGGGLINKDEYNKIKNTGTNITSKKNKGVLTTEEYNKVKNAGVNINPKKKMQKGGFPDLNKDGKVTKADILKGRGVIKRIGGSIKKK